MLIPSHAIAICIRLFVFTVAFFRGSNLVSKKQQQYHRENASFHRLRSMQSMILFYTKMTESHFVVV